MPFDLRCPDCRAKLRLDKKPDRDAPIECPKCGSTFTPADSAAADKSAGVPADAPKAKKEKKSKKKGSKEAQDGAPVGEAPIEGKERTFFNPFALLGIIAACLLVYIGVCWFVLNTLGKSGRVEDMVAFIPKECNTVRGADLGTLNLYPGYKSELDKYSTPLVTAALDELVKANGLPPAAFQDYMVYGRSKDKTVTTTVYAFRCKQDITSAAVKAALKATDENVSGGPCLRMPADAPGLLAGALVDIPTRRHAVIVPATGNADQSQTLAASRAATADRAKSFAGDLGDTGKVVIRGHGWVLARPTGANASFNTYLADNLQKDFPQFVEQLKTSKMLGVWNSFGGSVRFAGGIDCASSSAASALAKTIKEGQMGKGDDAELPRGFKTVFSSSYNKEFRVMMNNFSFKTSGTCAYYTSGLRGEAAKQMLQNLNTAAMFDGGAQ